MRILIAPDSFKGSLDAAHAAAAIAEGIRAAIPNAEIECVPMADGGEGTRDILLCAAHGQRREMVATGPLGDDRNTVIGLVDGAATAIIELADIAGLALVPADRRDPLVTTTYGVGEVIRAAIDTGVEKILLTVGGSATVDGGLGMMQALGLTAYDRNGRALPPGAGGGRLSQIARVSLDGLCPGLVEMNFELAVDVLNPLCGPDGAAAVFAPQKGANGDAVVELSRGLEHWVSLLEGMSGRDIRSEPGCGASGGVAAPLMAIADAQIVPGIDYVIEAVGLRDRVLLADLVVTGEGRLDKQTRMGKVVSGVARLSQSAGVRCAAVVGDLGPGSEAFEGLLDPIVSLTQLAGGCGDAQRNAVTWLRRAGELLAKSL